MRIVRATNVSVIDFIKPHLLPDDDIPVEQYAGNLSHLLTHDPSSIFIIVAFDQELCCGFLIAYAPAGMKYAFVSQAWIENDIAEHKLSDQFYLRLTRWCDAINRREIRFETYRDQRGFTRKWDFKPISVTMSLNIDSDETQARIDKILLENNNEQKRRSKQHLDTQPAAETDQHPDRRLSIGSTGSDEPSVHGELPGSEPASVRAGDAAADNETAEPVQASDDAELGISG